MSTYVVTIKCENVKRILRELGLGDITANRFAKELGVDTHVTQRLLRNEETKCHASTAVKLCEYLGCSGAYIMGKTKDAYDEMSLDEGVYL